jgi:hypothetical protein
MTGFYAASTNDGFESLSFFPLVEVPMAGLAERDQITVVLRASVLIRVVVDVQW